jgi:TonB-linked SusC/RagA family outer membrane protein
MKIFFTNREVSFRLRNSLIRQLFQKRHLAILLFLLAIPFSLLAQKSITGTVKDQNGAPVASVTVKVQNHPTAATTDAEGNFSIKIPALKSILVFTSIGFTEKQVVINDWNPLQVIMEGKSSTLNDVVVVGYGKSTKELLTSSISKLDPKTLENVPYANVLSAMQGSIAGVRVQSINGQPGAAPRVTLRGGTAINNSTQFGSNTPLYLVDGVIRSNLNDIPADDIESLQVLKDAAATSIYGARASNGVVLVTTKTAKSGVTRISYSYDVTFADATSRMMEYVSARDYIYYARLSTLAATGKSTLATINGRLALPSGFGTGNDLTKSTPYTTQYLTPQNQYKLNEGWQSMADPIDPTKTIIFSETDFQALTYKTSVSHNHYLSVSGGTEKAKFSASLGYLLSDGTALESWYNRISANLNGNLKVTNKLRINARMLFSNADFSGPGVGSGGLNTETNAQFGPLANTFYRSASLPSTAKYRFEDGTMAPGGGAANGNPDYYQTGPYAPKVKNVAGKINVSLDARYDILPGLAFEPLISYYEENAVGRSFQPAFLSGISTFNTQRNTNQYNNNTSNYQADAVLSFVKSLGDHNIDIKAGYSYYTRILKTLSATGQGAGTDLIPTLNASAIPITTTGLQNQLVTEGVFSRLNYNFKQKYLVSLTGRYDGASNLGSINRFAFFPGVGLGWNIHKENFWKAMPKQISSIKLRGTYGENGNIQGLGDYDWQGLYSVGASYNGAAAVQTSVFPNLDLKWEQSKTLDGGVDFGLFANRVSVSFDYYERVTQDLLASVILPGSSGYSSAKTNNGSLKNKGIELELNVNLFPSSSAFQWSMNFNASKVSSRVLKLPFNGVLGNLQGGLEVWDPAAGAYVWKAGWGAGSAFGSPNSFIEGGRIGDMYAFKQIGIYATDADAAKGPVDRRATPDLVGGGFTKYGGDVNYEDIDGNGIIDDRDQVYVGNVFPTWTGGFSNYFTYKSLSLAIRTDFTTGHTIYNYAKVIADAQFQGDLMPTKDFIDKSWKKQGDITNTPRYTYQINGDVHRNSTSYEKGDFLCLREVTLAYNLPANLLKRVKINGMRINVTGNNLYYLTKYSGPVPEEGGSDNGHYPNPRAIILGINISL